jgi:hypothetical protein
LHFSFSTPTFHTLKIVIQALLHDFDAMAPAPNLSESRGCCIMYSRVEVNFPLKKKHIYFSFSFQVFPLYPVE